MRLNGIPDVFQVSWPFKTRIDFDFSESLSWSPWGVFKTGNIHCYTDDYRFEGVWRKPEFSLKRALELNFVISPDFSVYQDAPSPVNSWQIYRSLAVFSYWQNMGVRVIPSITWVSAKQILDDLSLYPKFNVISVRSPGSGYTKEWIDGAQVINDLLKPMTVLHFGPKRGIDLWSNSNVINYSLRPHMS